MASAGSVSVWFKGDLTGLNAAVARANKSLKSFGNTAKNIGTNLTQSISLPLLAIGGVAAKTATTFEQEMVKIETLVLGVGHSTARWGEELKRIAPLVGRGPEELARALFVVTSAGERTETAMEIVTASAKAAAIGLGDTADIARTVTAAMTAYGKENLSASRAINVLIGTVKEGNLVASALAGTLGRVIGIAQQVGVSFEEVGAFVATFTRLGVKADEAVTALRGVLQAVIKPGEGVAAAFEDIEQSGTFLAEGIKKKGLTETMLELMRLFEGNTEAIGKVIPRMRALSGVFGVAGEQAETFRAITNFLKGDLDLLAQGFERTSKTAAFRFAQLKAKVQVAAIAIGDQLLPVLIDLVDTLIPAIGKITSMAQVFSRLPPWVKTTTVTFGLMAIALGPLIFAIGSLAIALGGLLVVLNLIKVPLITAAAGIGLFGAAIGGAFGIAYLALRWADNQVFLNSALKDMSAQVAMLRERLGRLNEEQVQAAITAAELQVEWAKAALAAATIAMPDLSEPTGLGAVMAGRQDRQIDLLSANRAAVKAAESAEAAMHKTALAADTTKLAIDGVTTALELMAEIGEIPAGFDTELVDRLLKNLEQVEGNLAFLLRRAAVLEDIRLEFEKEQGKVDLVELERILGAEQNIMRRRLQLVSAGNEFFLESEKQLLVEQLRIIRERGLEGTKLELTRMEDILEIDQAIGDSRQKGLDTLLTVQQAEQAAIGRQIQFGRMALSERLAMLEEELKNEQLTRDQRIALEDEQFVLLQRRAADRIRLARTTSKGIMTAELAALHALRDALQSSADEFPAILAQIEDAILNLENRMLAQSSRMEMRLRRAGQRIGEQFIDGIINGTLDMQSLLKQAMGTLIKLMLSRFTLGFQFGSPSKVSREWGQWIGQGLSMGMLDTRSMVSAASNKMVAAVSVGSMAPSGTLAVAGGTDLSEFISSLQPSDPILAARKPELQRFVAETIVEIQKGGMRFR